MDNMSYCRFENTLRNMIDCLESLGSMTPSEYIKQKDSSYDEREAIAEMRDVAIELAEALKED